MPPREAKEKIVSAIHVCVCVPSQQVLLEADSGWQAGALEIILCRISWVGKRQAAAQYTGLMLLTVPVTSGSISDKMLYMTRGRCFTQGWGITRESAEALLRSCIGA
jgi:hypothetical protein